MNETFNADPRVIELLERIANNQERQERQQEAMLQVLEAVRHEIGMMRHSR